MHVMTSNAHRVLKLDWNLNYVRVLSIIPNGSPIKISHFLPFFSRSVSQKIAAGKHLGNTRVSAPFSIRVADSIVSGNRYGLVGALGWHQRNRVERWVAVDAAIEMIITAKECPRRRCVDLFIVR